MSSPPRKFKCSALEWFSYPEGITPHSGLTGPNNTIYIYIYIYIHSWASNQSLSKDWTYPHAHNGMPQYIYIKMSDWAIVLMSRVFANGPGDHGSIPGQVVLKTQKMVLDATLLTTQHYKVRIEGKVEQSRERCSACPSLYWKGNLQVTLHLGHQLYLLRVSVSDTLHKKKYVNDIVSFLPVIFLGVLWPKGNHELEIFYVLYLSTEVRSYLFMSLVMFLSIFLMSLQMTFVI